VTTAAAAGEAEIRCTYQSIAGSATLRVSAPATPTTPTTTGVSITGLSGDLKPGQTAQLTATATLSNGSTQNVTNQATWSTTNTTAATVNSTGLVTAGASGDADIRAAYQGITGTVRVRVVIAAPSSYSLSGVVTESKGGKALPGVSVQIVGGLSTSTGSNGSYSLSGLTGTITVRLSVIGYGNQEFGITLTGNATRNVSLEPSLSESSIGICNVSGSVTADCGTASAFCKDGWYSCSQNRSGTCSSHGGVKCWLCPGVLCNPFSGTTEALWTPVRSAMCSAAKPQ
jgi:hypothetical protein